MNRTSTQKTLAAMPTTTGVLQRQCACGAKTPGGATCPKCQAEQDRALLQRSPARAGEPAAKTTEPAAPLNQATLDFFEPRFLSAPLGIQPKLTINQPGDQYEQEADRIADTVMRTPTPTVQRKCDCGAKASGECETCKKKEPEPAKTPPKVQRTATAGVQGEAPPIVHDVLASPGEPLPSAVRGHMETRFGQDFSAVRIHTGGDAAASAHAIAARAYTVGSHIVFGGGQFQPSSEGGNRLLAHELTHTLQKSGAPPHVQRACWGWCPKTKAELASFPNVAGVKPIADDAEQKLFDIYLQKAIDRTFVYRGKVVGSFPPQERKTTRSLKKYGPGKKKLNTPELEERRSVEQEIIKGVAPKAPDIVDFAGFEIYDVTTNAGTAEKTKKIKDTYLPLLNDATRKIYRRDDSEDSTIAKSWQAGNSMSPPSKLIYILNQPALGFRDILFTIGCTDFSTDAGVLQYYPIGCGVVGCADVLANIGPASNAPPGRASKNLTTINVFVGKRKISFDVDPNANQSDIDKAAANAIPGLTLLTYHPKQKKSNEHITAVFTGWGSRNSPGATKAKDNSLELNVGSDGKLALDGSSKKYKSRFPFLSDVSLDLDLKDDRVVGKGRLVSDKPLLKSIPLEAIIDGEKISVGLPEKKGEFKTGIPGLTVTKASAALEILPTLGGHAGVEFVFGPVAKPLAIGSLDINADPQKGITGEGKIDVKIPKADKAGGTITYDNGAVKGHVEIGSSQLQIPGLQSASITVDLTAAGITVSGNATVALPGGNNVTFGVKLEGSRWLFTGETDLKIPVPAVQPVHLKISYDGKRFVGHGDTSVSIHGIGGSLGVDFVSDDKSHSISGKGSLTVDRGRAKGKVNLVLSPQMKLSGDGSLEYRLTDNLIAQVGVIYTDQGKLTVSGAVRFPKPIRLFEGVKGDKVFFTYTQQIPIPGLSIPVLGGVIAEVSLKLGANYGVGPGELRDVGIEGKFDPLEENQQAEIHASALLDIPAYAGLYASVDGGLGIGGAIASATGGINVRGEAGLRGGFQAKVDLHYKEHKFSADAEAAIRASLVLKLSLGAYLKARLLTQEWRKDWNLAGFEWGAGQQFALIAPFHYATGEPFHPPSLDSIRFEAPKDLDVKSAIGQLFSNAKKTEETT